VRWFEDITNILGLEAGGEVVLISSWFDEIMMFMMRRYESVILFYLRVTPYRLAAAHS